jgi:glycosyltransferase involved in cell wall biosynthesis
MTGFRFLDWVADLAGRPRDVAAEDRVSGTLARLGLGLLGRCPPRLVDAAAWLPPLRRAAARLHEYRGRLRRAAGLAGGDGTRYGARLAELAAALDRGGLPLPPPAPERRASGFNGRVVMALYGSEPWFANGYSIRTRCLLEEIAAAGVCCVPATRPNFPLDLAAGRNAPRRDEEEYAGRRYRRLPAGPGMMDDPVGDYIASFADGLANLVRAGGASVVHAASNHVVGLAACLAAERTGARSVYEIRGLWHWSTATRRPGWEASETFALHEALERQAALRADRVVVLSRPLADHVRRWGVPEERIAIVANGVDADAFKPLPPDRTVRKALGAGTHSFLAGFVGTFTPYEGLDTLLEALATIRARGIDAAAALIGDGEEKPRLQALARKLRVPACFPGRVPFEQVPAYLAACDVYPVSRRDTYVAALVPPLKLAEAMACAVPVVVADLPPLTESVVHERTGLVYGHGAAALAVALQRVHADPDFAAALAAAGRDWVAKHRTWRIVTAPLLSVYSAPMTQPAGAR